MGEHRVHGLRVIYDPAVPPEVEAALQPCFAKWRWILPATCHELAVEFEPNPSEPGDLMACSPSPEYRRADIRVFPRWLVEEETERERYVLHELCHVVVGPLTEFTAGIIQRDEKAVRAVLEEQHRCLFEGVVSDLTQCLMERDQANPAMW